MKFFALNKSKIFQNLPEGRVTILNTVNSTNQYVIDNMSYVKSGDVFVTEQQTAGRGSRNKLWFSPFGKNIYFSIYWKLNQFLPKITELSMIISIIIADILKKLGVPSIEIKWPNDLYIDHGKLAGILVEIFTQSNRSISHIIIGIGINISMDMSDRWKSNMNINWISLKDIGFYLDRNILIAILSKELRYKLKFFEKYGFRSFLY